MRRSVMSILEAQHISLGRQVRDVSFKLRRGEVLGIAGLVGAGRSELVETIFGMAPQGQRRGVCQRTKGIHSFPARRDQP